MFQPHNNKKLDSMETPKLALGTLTVLALQCLRGYVTLKDDARSAQIGCGFLQKQLSGRTK